MAIKINLLPTESVSSFGNRKIGRQIKSLVYILVPLYVIMILGFGGYYLVNFFRIRNANLSIANLKAQVKDLETTEQKLYLVKDRLTKLKSAQATYKLKQPVENANSLLSILPSDAVVSELAIEELKLSISVSFVTADSFSQFLRSLYSTNLFTNVVMESFGFNTTGGYLLTLNFK